jgi:hypothetical protein
LVHTQRGLLFSVSFTPSTQVLEEFFRPLQHCPGSGEGLICLSNGCLGFVNGLSGSFCQRGVTGCSSLYHAVITKALLQNFNVGLVVLREEYLYLICCRFHRRVSHTPNEQYCFCVTSYG